VTELTDSDLIDVYLARETLEAAAVRQVMRSHRLDALCRVLTGIVKQMEKAGARSDWQRMMELDFDFHRELVAAAGSPRLSRMYATVQAEARLCLHLLIGGYRGSAALVDEHQILLDSLRTGDPEATVDELRRHFGDPVSLLERAKSRREKQRASDAA
jgi:DNA-binding GntR family transcriptional regulator